MKGNNKILLGLIAILLIAGVVYWFLIKDKPQPTEDKQLEQVSVRMKWFYSGTMSGWFAGKEEGIFETNGIDLTINSGGPDNSSIKLVASGSDLFGVAGADEVLIAREKGIPIVPIAVLFKESPIGFISKKDKGIKSPKDWEGKKIEVDYGSNAEIQYRALLKKFDVKNTQEAPYTYSLIPFIEDKVDVSVAYIMDQVITLKNQGIDVDVIISKDYGINPYGDVIITTEKTLKEKPELVQSFLKGSIESQKWAIEHDSLAINHLVSKANNLKTDNELKVWRATIPFLIPNNDITKLGVMDKSRWEETQKVLLEFNALKEAQNIDF